MDLSRNEVRLLLLHEYRLGHEASEAQRNICTTMGKGTLSYETAKVWFRKFKEGNFDLEDKQHPGRKPSVDLDVLVQLIERDPRATLNNLAEELSCNPKTVANNLRKLGKRWKFGVWVPHELTPQQLQNRTNVCMELLSFRRTTAWIRNVITSDEKWVLYSTTKRKRQWLATGETGVPTVKPDLHPKKVLLSVWWGTAGVIHWELLPSGKTINAAHYCQQLDTVAQKLEGQKNRIFYLHDNAKPHIAKVTRQKLLELGWTVLPHPPYSPDLAPTDYHLFRSLTNSLGEKKFANEEDLKRFLDQFFASKSLDFYEQGILSLAQRWQDVVDNDGTYLIEM